MSLTYSLLQKIAEEQQLRQDLQVKLLQSEQQLTNIKMSINSNGPTMDLPDFSQNDIAPSE